jgi:hypothetical protein
MFLDSEGYAFALAPPLRGGAFIRYLTEEMTPEIGMHVTTAEMLSGTKQLVAALEMELALLTNIVRFTKEGDGEILLHGGGMLKIAFDMPMQDTFDNLKSILGSEEFSHIEPGNFNYIDLRFGNRVFVNEEFEEIETLATSTDEISFDVEEN